MRSAIEQHCESCEACESRRKPIPQRRAPLQSISAVRPFQFVCTDITELPVTSSGQVKSSHLYLYSAFNNTNCNKALHNIKIGKFVNNVK